MTRVVHEPARDITVIRETDVLVVGSGQGHGCGDAGTAIDQPQP